MSFHFMDVDPSVLYIIQEIARWAAANIVALSIVTNILQWLKKKAIQSNKVTDDKILSFLLSAISFNWLTTIRKNDSSETRSGDK